MEPLRRAIGFANRSSVDPEETARRSLTKIY